MPNDPSKFSKEMYSLAEEKVPFGRVVAPLTLTLVVSAILVGAGRYIFDALIRPLAATVTRSFRRLYDVLERPEGRLRGILTLGSLRLFHHFKEARSGCGAWQ